MKHYKVLLIGHDPELKQHHLVVQYDSGYYGYWTLTRYGSLTNQVRYKSYYEAESKLFETIF